MFLKIKQWVWFSMAVLVIGALLLPVLLHTKRPLLRMGQHTRIPAQPDVPTVVLSMPKTLHAALQKGSSDAGTQARTTPSTSSGASTSVALKSGAQHAALSPSAKQQAAPQPASVQPKTASKASSSTAVQADPEEDLALLPYVNVPKAWSLQVGSYGTQANAQAMIQRLRAAGFAAYSKKQAPASDGSRLLRVYVGPALNQTSMLQMQKVLKKQFQLSALMVRYEP